MIEIIIMGLVGVCGMYFSLNYNRWQKESRLAMYEVIKEKL
jgi:hypothetical protein